MMKQSTSTSTSTSIRRQEQPRQKQLQLQLQQPREQEEEPSTPPPSRSSSSRPIPPWPVSPASNEYAYSSPDVTATTPLDRTVAVCPGAPKKKRYPPQRRFFPEDEDVDDDDDDDDDPEDHMTSMFQRGFRPRRLDFNNNDCNSNEDPDQPAGFPILRMESSQSSSPSRIQHDDQNCPVLGLRPSPGKRGTATRNWGVVPPTAQSQRRSRPSGGCETSELSP